MARLLAISKPVALLQLLWGAVVVYAASDGATSVAEYLVYFAGGCLFVGLTGLLAVACLWARRVPRAFAIQTIVLIAVFFTVSLDLAFGARFLVSRQSLEEAVRQISAGTESKDRRWVGLFRVRQIDTAQGAEGVVRFILGDCGLDECGVVYSARGQPPRVDEDLYRPMGGPWWHWQRSW